MQKYEFKAEMKQLLHLIIHSLYTHPEVFIRELISNASDALNKVRFNQLTNNDLLNADLPLSIKINADKETSQFSIEDTGIGMTKDELIGNIGVIANSGTLEFLDKLKQTPNADINSLIGHFGVGFYSVFMVCDEVTIITRSANNDSIAYKWISQGENDFTIEETEKETRGTIISFTFKENYKHFAEEWWIKNTINKFSNFVNFPILVNNVELERVSAIWHKKKEDINDEELNEFYKFISNDYHNPASHLVLNIEGQINFKAILFLPSKAPQTMFQEAGEKSLQLYVNRVFIQDDAKELLPEYLRFIKGVVEAEDIPLNVSREFTQSSPVISKIKNILISKILNWFEDISSKNNDEYLTIFKNFGSLFKTGLNSDFTNKNKIVELLRFDTTKTTIDKLISLKEYTLRMQSDQKDIYYIFGAAKELIIHNPNLEYFRKKEIEVILLTDPIDVFVIPYIGQYENKNLLSIEKADIPIDTNNDIENTTGSGDFIGYMKEVLKDKVENVVASKRLFSSPVTLVVSKEGVDSQMEKVMQIFNKEYTASKKILEVNLQHPLLQNLINMHDKDANDGRVLDAVWQLFDGATLIEGQIKDVNSFVQRMFAFMTDATKTK